MSYVELHSGTTSTQVFVASILWSVQRIDSGGWHLGSAPGLGSTAEFVHAFHRKSLVFPCRLDRKVSGWGSKILLPSSYFTEELEKVFHFNPVVNLGRIAMYALDYAPTQRELEEVTEMGLEYLRWRRHAWRRLWRGRAPTDLTDEAWLAVFPIPISAEAASSTDNPLQAFFYRGNQVCLSAEAYTCLRPVLESCPIWRIVKPGEREYAGSS